MASILLVLLGTSEGARQALFVTLSAFCVLGALIFLTMPSVEGQEDKAPGILDTARLAAHGKVALMIPLMVTNGMTIASFLGDFQTDVTCPICGEEMVGFVVACFFGVNAISSALWGRFISRKLLSRRLAFCFSGLLLCSFLVCKMFWDAHPNYAKPPGSTAWHRIKDPKFSDVLIVFLLAALFATGDAFFESGPPMTLQGFYANSSFLMPAMANYKLWQSVSRTEREDPLDLRCLRGGLCFAILLGYSIEG